MVRIRQSAPFQDSAQQKQPHLLSLYCGPGGLDEGFYQAGYKTILAADVDAAACKTHQHNHKGRGTTTLTLDLSATTPTQLVEHWRESSKTSPSGIIGGPPCQSFSISNVHKKDEDPRDTLPLHYAAVVAKFKHLFEIDFFVFENVTGLLKPKHSDAYDQFLQACEKAGMETFEQTLDAVDYGVPQYRQRLIVVGINKKKFPNAQFKCPPKADATVKVKDVLLGLPEPIHFRKGLDPEQFKHHQNHWCMVPKSPKFGNGTLKPGCSKSRSFRTLHWEEPSWTVAYGHREVHIHPDCKRRLSVYEAMLLQGFPTDYLLTGTLSQQISQVSDAVPPPVAKAIALAIGDCLGYSLVPRPPTSGK